MVDIETRAAEALKDMWYPKNYIVRVLNEDGSISHAIENDNLVYESVNLTEHMCSSDLLEFGLCEGSEFEFQYFSTPDNPLPNIKGRRIHVTIEVDYPAANGAMRTQAIALGYFDVEECSRQASTNVIKAKAYNKLKSDYLDAPGREILKNSFSNENQKISIKDITSSLLEKYSITTAKPMSRSVAPADQFLYYTRFAKGFKFTATKGVNHPINAYPTTSTSTTFYPMIVSDRTEINFWQAEGKKTNMVRIGEVEMDFDIDYETDETHFFYKEFPHILEYMEQAVLEQLRTEFGSNDGAPINVTGEDLYQYLTGYTGSSRGNWIQYQYLEKEYRYTGTAYSWGDCCRLVVSYIGGEEELYGTVAYNSGDKRFTGTFADVAKKNFPLKDVGYIYIVFPRQCYATSSTSGVSPAAGGMMLRCSEPDEGSTLPWRGTRFYDYVYKGNAGDEITDRGLVRVFYPPNERAVLPPYKLAHYLTSYEVESSEMENVTAKISDLPDFTLREVQSAVFESVCQFGKLDRETDMFSGLELQREPVDTIDPDMYSQLWADEGNIRSWRSLLITYKTIEKDENGNDAEVDKVLERVISQSGTDDYVMDNNWLFVNLIWTEEQVAQYADAMAAKLTGMEWFPFEAWTAGLPYLETGDCVSVELGGQTYKSYVLQRKLKGIHNLQDEMINGSLDIF